MPGNSKNNINEQDAEDRDSLLFESNPLPMWMYDLESLAFLAVNRAAVRKYGYTREEFLSMTIKDIRPPEDIPILLRNISRTTVGFEIGGTWRHRTKSGEIMDVAITSHDISYRDRPARFVLAIDVTEQKRAEEALRAGEERKDAIVRSSPDAIVTMDHEGKITEFNPAAEQLFGYLRSEVIDKDMAEIIIPPRLRDKHHAGLKRYLETGIGTVLGHRIEMPAIRRDGTEFPVELSINRAGTQTPPAFTGFIRDISDRKRSEESTRRYAAIVESTEDAIISKTLNGVINGWNAAATRMFGYEPEEALGQPIFIIVPPDRTEEETQILEKLKHGERIDHFETVRQRKDGSRIEVSETISPIEDSSGTIIGASKIARDVTDRKRAERALRTSEQHKESLLRLTRRLEQSQTFFRALEGSLEEIQAVLGYKNIWAYMFGPDGETATLITAQGEISEMARNEIPHLVVKGDAFLEEIFRATGPVVVEDARTDHRTNKAIVEKLKNRTIINVPLIMSDRKIGALGTGTFGDEGVKVPDPAGLQYFASMANHVAITFDRIQLLAEREEAEAQLRWREERFRSLIEHSADALSIVDAEGVITYVGPSSRRILGFDPEELIGKKGFEFIHPDDLPSSAQLFADLAKKPGTSISLKQRILHKDGRWLSMEGTVTNLLNEPGIAGIVSNFRDITDRAKLEQDRLELFRRQTFLAEASSILASSLDYKTTITSLVDLVTPTLADWCSVDLIGPDGSLERLAVSHRDPEKVRLAYDLQRKYPTDPSSKMGVHEVIRTGKSQLFADIPDAMLVAIARDEEHLRIMRALQLRSAIVSPLVARDQILGAITFVWADSEKRYDEGDVRLAEDLARRAGLAIDNSRLFVESTRLNAELEQRVAERTSQLEAANDQLAHQREDLQSFIDGMSTFTAKLAPDGTFLIVNKTALVASGLSREDLFKTNFLDGQWWSFDPEVHARVTAAFEKSCAGFTVNYDERIFVMGSVPIINFSLIPIFRNNRVEHIIAEGRDITSLKTAEAALRDRSTQLEVANKELEAFSFSVSHDLRAPLRSIDGFSQILLESYSSVLDQQARDYLCRVRASSQRMALLIDDLLNLSRISRMEMNIAEVQLTAIATDVIAEIRRNDPTRNVDVTIQEGMIDKGDPRLVRIALENLLGNAWKYTRKKAQATIEFGMQEGQNPPVYWIRDNGTGFDMAYSDKLFGAFQRLHSSSEFEGTGIGLATVQRIMRRHGGRAWAEGVPDRGATFYFTLHATE